MITRYERVVFDRANVRVDGAVAQADLLAPGHPLLDAVVDLTVERHRSTLKQGTVLVDRDDPGETADLNRQLLRPRQRGIHHHPTTPCSIHLEGAPSPEPIRTSTTRILPGQGHFSLFRHPSKP